jgi:hypothetical protein
MCVSGNNQARIGVGDVHSVGGASAVQGATGVHGAGVAGARQVAAGGLFIQNPDASGDYLFEARPQFANQGQCATQTAAWCPWPRWSSPSGPRRRRS